MTRIGDIGLGQLFQRIASERAENPRRRMGLDDLDSILAHVADRRGQSAEQVRPKLKALADRKDKLEFAKAGLNVQERRDVEVFLEQSEVPMTLALRKALSQLIGSSEIRRPTAARIDDKEIFLVKTGPMKTKFDDDKIFLGKDGVVKGSSGVKGFSRSYLATSFGPLRFRHGSEVPESVALTKGQRERHIQKTPGQALDAAAKLFGARARDFEKMANAEAFYNPEAANWEGMCHAWSWAALSKPICDLVDVKGPVGERGLWIGGEWLSRADLGNWMMGVAHMVSLADEDTLFDDDVTPEDLLKAIGEFMLYRGGGVVADIYNDAREGSEQTWNQPFVAAEVKTTTLKGRAAAEILCQARADDVNGAVRVKLVETTGTYVDESSDDHEDVPSLDTKRWNMYTVLDADGQVLKAYMADDRQLQALSWLPVRDTEGVPDLFRKPKLQPLKDVFRGEESWEVEAMEYGWNFEFFVNTVLSKGVPAAKREGFENAVAQLGENPSKTQVQALVQEYKGVGNGYSPTQWKRAFGKLGFDPVLFGADWAVTRDLSG